jgi:hypothetical protein
VVELEHGITVYPARTPGGRWRAVCYEDGVREQCESVSEEKLAAKLEKVTERLAADAPNMRRPGADLIAWYLNPDRLPAERRWSRRHADTQWRLCQRFAAPVIGTVACQDIKTRHTQQIVNAAPTAGEGKRVHRMVSALVSVGIDGGYLVSSRLARVHWQASDRTLPAPAVSVAGESPLWVDPAEIPSVGDVARVITVDRKVVEVGGRLYVEAPKNRKFRRAIYPRVTPAGYPLAERLAIRVQTVQSEKEDGANPFGLVFPSPKGKYLRSSNFRRNVLKRAYLDAGWRDGSGEGRWTWHSLRHVFCTTALFTWKLEPTDVSRTRQLPGHA